MSTSIQFAGMVSDLLAQQPNPAPAPSGEGIRLEKFEPLPEWFIPLVASVIFLFLFKKWGDQVSAADNRWLDLGLDIGTLASAGSIVAAISSWPLMQAVTKVIAAPINKFSWTVPGVGWQLGPTALLIVIVIIFAWRYTSTESWPMLISFGLTAQVTALTWGWINEIFGFMINWPIRGVWYAVVWVINFIPDLPNQL